MHDKDGSARLLFTMQTSSNMSLLIEKKKKRHVNIAKA